MRISLLPERSTAAMVLVIVLVALTGYSVFDDPPAGTVGSAITTAVLLAAGVWTAKHGRRPGAAFGSGLVISYSAQALLDSGLVRNLVAGGLWVGVTYLLCDLPRGEKKPGTQP